MTYSTKLPLRANTAAVRLAYETAGWIVPPVVIPILLTIMVGMRAAYLAYPW